MQVEVLQGKKGMNTLRCEGVLVHSLYDPRREARRLVQPILKSQDELIVVFGCGLGYHLEWIAEKIKKGSLIAFEPSQEIYRAFCQNGHRSQAPSERFWVTTHVEEFNDILSGLYVYNPLNLSMGLFILPAYARLFPSELASFRENLNRIVTRRTTNRETIVKKKDPWFENFMENIPHLLETPDITSLAGSFEGVPCFLVGAGPSLSKNVNFLKKVKGRALIFCANAALARLVQEGVQPEITGILESIDVSSHVKCVSGILPSYLAIAATSHPNHFAMEAKGRFVFHTQKWASDLLGNDIFTPNGGHVASAGFTIAVILGCNPIILVGQDLAFDGKKLHAEGTMGPAFLPEGSKLITLEGFDGEPVLSHRTMLSYLLWYEESAAYLRRKDTQRILLNATEGGAKISGIPNISLREAAENFCPREIDCEGVLKKYVALKPLRSFIPLIKVEELIMKIERFLKEYEGSRPSGPMREFIAHCSFAEGFFQDISEKDVDLRKALVYLNHLQARIKRYLDGKSG